jgi:hypothetical protein
MEKKFKSREAAIKFADKKRASGYDAYMIGASKIAVVVYTKKK